ncbi:uncharacterized protein MYCFIDRAFT_171582 [Pseudocercospora fijiensis CIRAD86]|uniref:Uncharacterized protein n=1 Tax=Pseudocercospora fijiensis (strain CIRAD86) TaxID=383855 RepID=M3A3M9_PSEFD|nr:uncharacterized protein MYCFIDRAFT_171582 [Pseudocercospora fijiensis CIRAD86]EME85694.1 hypothetical protein MYCFIDRAFT_171582 [Pseudocercospora fijiensis CIRAD86]
METLEFEFRLGWSCADGTRSKVHRKLLQTSRTDKTRQLGFGFGFGFAPDSRRASCRHELDQPGPEKSAVDHAKSGVDQRPYSVASAHT